MPPTSMLAELELDLDHDNDVAAAPAPSEEAGSFADRARHLVAFLAACNAGAKSHPPREHDLVEWIARWRRRPLQGIGSAQHFVGDELGIIARALNGPATARARLRDDRNQDLCWLLARCISDGI